MGYFEEKDLEIVLEARVGENRQISGKSGPGEADRAAGSGF